MTGDFDDEQGDGGTSQLDVVLSFLGILLLYVVVLFLAAAQRGDGVVDTPLRVAQEGPAMAILARYRLVYPFEEQWLVQGRRAARLDLARITREAAAADPPLSTIDFADGSRVEIQSSAEGGLTGFVLTVERPLAGAGPSEARGPFDRVLTLDDALGEMAGPGRRVRVFVFHLELADAVDLVAGLQRAGGNPRVIVSSDLCRGRWCVGFERQAAGFAADGVFR